VLIWRQKNDTFSILRRECIHLQDRDHKGFTASLYFYAKKKSFERLLPSLSRKFASKGRRREEEGREALSSGLLEQKTNGYFGRRKGAIPLEDKKAE